MDSLVSACIKQEVVAAREVYSRLRPYRHNLRHTSRARYDAMLASEESYDGKLMALGFLALIRQDEDFLSILSSLRERWITPFADAALGARWTEIERRWIVVTAEQALDPEDQMIASVVAFILLEQLRENDSSRLGRSIELLQTTLPTRFDGAPAPSTIEIPDPWISAILKHSSRRISEFIEPTRTQFLAYVAWICGRYEFTPRLRHQAKLMLYRPADTKFDLLAQIGDAMSEHDAAKAIADFLSTHKIDATDLELIIDCLTVKFGRAKIGHIMAWTFKSMPSLADPDYTHSLAGLFVSLITQSASEELCAAAVDGLRSLDVEFAPWWKKKNKDEVPLLLDGLGFDPAPYLRTALKARPKIRERCGQVAGNIFEWNIVWHIFELPVPLPQQLELLDELTSNVSAMRFSLLSAILKCLRRASVDNLLLYQTNVISRIDKLLACEREKMEGSDSQSSRISAAWAMTDLSAILKLCAYPQLSDAASNGISTMRQAYRSGLKADGGLAKRLESYLASAEAGYDELVRSGYSLSK